MRNVLLGMALQAIITALLTLTGFMNFRPGQQLFAAGVFILLSLLLEKSKNKEN